MYTGVLFVYLHASRCAVPACVLLCRTVLVCVCVVVCLHASMRIVVLCLYACVVLVVLCLCACAMLACMRVCVCLCLCLCACFAVRVAPLARPVALLPRPVRPPCRTEGSGRAPAQARPAAPMARPSDAPSPRLAAPLTRTADEPLPRPPATPMPWSPAAPKLCDNGSRKSSLPAPSAHRPRKNRRRRGYSGGGRRRVTRGRRRSREEGVSGKKELNR
jgi:hypothetical protein